MFFTSFLASNLCRALAFERVAMFGDKEQCYGSRRRLDTVTHHQRVVRGRMVVVVVDVERGTRCMRHARRFDTPVICKLRLRSKTCAPHASSHSITFDHPALPSSAVAFRQCFSLFLRSVPMGHGNVPPTFCTHASHVHRPFDLNSTLASVS